jgi:hypothetical protein
LTRVVANRPDVTACYREHGVVAQYEASILLGLTVLLVGAAVWWLRKRLR